MTLKSDVTRAAYSPEADTAPALSEKIESGLNAPDAVTKAAAEAMIPAQDISEYSFKWENAASMEIGELQSMDALAKETAFAVKAPPAFARATLEAMDKQLSKPEGSYTPTTADALDSHLQTQLGDKAGATSVSTSRSSTAGRKATNISGAAPGTRATCGSSISSARTICTRP